MAKRQHVSLYNGRTRALKCVMGNATQIGYKPVLNNLWTGHLSLPATDPHHALIAAHDLVEFTDGKRGKILMRVVEQPEDEGGGIGTLVPYSLESVNCTLLDDPYFGYQEIGGTGMRTAACISWILARQDVQHWVLGDCELDYAYQYVMQNNNLLALLYSLSTCMQDKHRWEFDTSTYPWRVHLRKVTGSRECAIIYGRNMGTVTRSWDAKALINRLYCAGYGEGVNLLTIRRVNGGLAYVQDNESIALYGVKGGIYTDKAIQDAATLKAAGQAAMADTAWPRYTYRATVADIYEATGIDYDRMQEGRVVWIYDRDRGKDVEAQIVSISREDIGADPYATEVEISEVTPDISATVSSLANRLGIAELYSQGSTQLFSDRFVDNASTTKPAIWNLYVPEDVRTINSVRLKIRMEKFRADSTAAAAGGGSATTSESGGGSATTSGAGGSATVSSESGGYSSGTKYTSGMLDADTYANMSYTEAPNSTVFAGHKHVVSHVHRLEVVTPSHTHSVNVPGHSHGVTIPAHAHAVAIPSHTHGITYGIYEGPQASGYTLYVDDTPVPASEIVGGIVDIAPWMATDDQGLITRGTDHTIELVPNGLTRVVMERFVRMYIQSIGGSVL